MMLLAHTGIELDPVWLPHKVAGRVRSGADLPVPGVCSSGSAAAGAAPESERLRFPVRPPDYRLVLAGSPLPDIIGCLLLTAFALDVIGRRKVVNLLRAGVAD